MPEALATIKRKFYKLLDPPSPSTTLHRPPTNTSTSTSTSTTEAVAREPSAKRIRSDETSASAIILARIQARNASSTSVASKASTASSTRPAVPPKDPPNFSPWSHETFLRRLKTFSPVTAWHPKPDVVNEVEWAKRGWSCVDTNTVACRGGCEKRVVVKMEPFARRGGAGSDEDGAEEGEGGKEEEDDGYDEQLEQALVERYKALIVDGHAEGCLWRQAGCKPDIYRLPVVRSAIWQPELRSRYASLMAISKSFGRLDLKPKDANPPLEKLLRDLPSSLLVSSSSNDTARTSTSSDEEDRSPAQDSESTEPETRSKALHISLCGWRGLTDSHTHLLSCSACFQRIGLWMYQPDYKRPGSSSSGTTAQDEDHCLDLVEMHREHCPWRNGASQSATGEYAGLPAWSILCRVVARYADEQRRRSRGQGLVSARVERAGREESVATAEDADGDGVGNGNENGVGAGDESVVLGQVQELSREEIAQQDKERSTKLRRLKTVLGMKRKPAAKPASGAVS